MSKTGRDYVPDPVREAKVCSTADNSDGGARFAGSSFVGLAVERGQGDKCSSVPLTVWVTVPLDILCGTNLLWW